jgi:hypothetical protein
MKITKHQLRQIIKEAISGKRLRDIAADEALRSFHSSPAGRMATPITGIRVTSVRLSPLEPEFETDVVLRVTIRTPGNDKRQYDIVLDSETGGYLGGGEVARY